VKEAIETKQAFRARVTPETKKRSDKGTETEINIRFNII